MHNLTVKTSSIWEVLIRFNKIKEEQPKPILSLVFFVDELFEIISGEMLPTCDEFSCNEVTEFSYIPVI